MTEEKKYTKAFNQGYQLSKENLKVLNTLKQAIKSPEYVRALEDGEEQHKKELVQKRSLELQKIQSRNKNRNRGRER